MQQKQSFWSKKRVTPGRGGCGPGQIDRDGKEWKDWLKTVRNFFSSLNCGVFTRVGSLGDHHSRPFLNVSILGSSCSGLLDSGSEISIVGSDASSLWSNQVTVYQPDRVDSIIAANGTRSPVTGFMFLPVTVNGRTETVKFYIIPGVTTRLIFGINFWQIFNIAPDVLSLLGRRGTPDSVSPQLSEVRYIHPFEDLSGEQRLAAVYGDSSFSLQELRFDSRSKFADKLGDLGAVFSRVGSRLQKSHGRSAFYYNRSRRDLEFEENDWVWRRTHQRSSADKFFAAKLAPKFERCRVVRKISRLVYLLEDASGRRSECHIKDLKGAG